MLTLIFRYFRAPVEHVAFRALDVFRAKNEGRLPTPGSEADATDLLGIATEINTTAKAAADAEEAAQKAAAAAAEAAGTEPAKNPPRIHAGRTSTRRRRIWCGRSRAARRGSCRR